MTALVVVSDDGIRGEVGRRIGHRPDGRTPAARNVGEKPYNLVLTELAESWECDPEDFSLIGPLGLKGTASTVTIGQAIRIGRMACKMAEGSIWTAADCCLLLADAKHKYEKIGASLGISADRAEKLACLARSFGKDERHPALPLTHHEEVRSLQPAAREDILRRAEVEHLPVSRVRELAREKKPDAARNNAGPKTRPTRSARTPVAPFAHPAQSEPNAPNTQGSVNVTEATPPPASTVIPMASGYVPEADPAPAGKAPAPSIVLAPVGLRLCLMDRDLSGALLEKVGRNQAAAESLLAEIVRAHLAAN